MSSSTQQVQRAASASRRAANRNDDMVDTNPGAVGPALRHGSGARESSREPRRVREPSVRGVRARATGPEETNDWLEALQATTNRFDTLERLVRSHASLINDLGTRAVEDSNRLNDHANKLDALNANQKQQHENLCEACRNIVSTYETKEQSRLMNEKMDMINAQLQALMSAVASMGVDVPTSQDVPEVHIGTPQNLPQPQQPAEVPAQPLDPWAIAAEAARVQTGQAGPTRTAQPSGPRAAPSAPPQAWADAQDPTSPFLQTPQPARPPQAAGQHGFVPPSASPHTRIQYMGDQEAINRKNESLRKFDGSAAKFANWAKHFIDHMAKMAKVHPAWRPALEWFPTCGED